MAAARRTSVEQAAHYGRVQAFEEGASTLCLSDIDCSHDLHKSYELLYKTVAGAPLQSHRVAWTLWLCKLIEGAHQSWWSHAT